MKYRVTVETTFTVVHSVCVMVEAGSAKEARLLAESKVGEAPDPELGDGFSVLDGTDVNCYAEEITE